VNAVGPGYVETELTRDYLDRDGHRAQLEALVPAQRLGRPVEVADAISFLLSDRAAFVTGQCLYIDGGRTLV
jgi:gluconate 5-dehydrogenase